jgi:dipeptidyl aminopeptidase/acylaminoacyl peptidase
MPTDHEFAPSRSLDEWRQQAMARGQRLIARRRALQLAPAVAALLLLGLFALPPGSGQSQRLRVVAPEPRLSRTPVVSSTTVPTPTTTEKERATGARMGASTSVVGASPRQAASPVGPSSTMNSTMAFSSDRSGQWRIYRLRGADQSPVALTDDKGNATSPDWSPDGKRLAYSYAFGGTASNNGLPSAIYVSDADGSRATAVTTSTSSFPTCGDAQHNSSECWDSTPAWSPDGHHIAFTRSPHKAQLAGCGTGYDGCPTIWIVDVDGPARNEHQVTTGRDPTWTPDGSSLVFSDAFQPSDTCPGCDLGHLFRIGVDSQGRRDLGVTGEAPAFSPDGRHLAYWSSPASVNGGPTVVVADPDGTHGTVVGTGQLPTWDASGVRLAVDVVGRSTSLEFIVVGTHATSPVDTGRPSTANDSSATFVEG